MIGDASTVRKQDISLRIVSKRGKKVPRKRTRSPGTATIVAKLATGPENALRSRETRPMGA